MTIIMNYLKFPQNKNEIIDSKPDIIRYSGCQYIRFDPGSNGSWGGHSGTCDNPIHITNKN